jgi:5,10-methylene-tetrahydrofolate dehydrogenase/methenyl tetrahydrofolate cyclohydrolase
MPVAHLLLRENATVTVCHSQTTNLADIVRRHRHTDTHTKAAAFTLIHTCMHTHTQRTKSI